MRHNTPYAATEVWRKQDRGRGEPVGPGCQISSRSAGPQMLHRSSLPVSAPCCSQFSILNPAPAIVHASPAVPILLGARAKSRQEYFKTLILSKTTNGTIHANRLNGEVSTPQRANVSPSVEAESQSTVRSHSPCCW